MPKDLESRIKTLESKLKALYDKNDHLNWELDDVKRELGLTERQLKDEREAADRLRKEVGDLHLELDDVKTKSGRLINSLLGVIAIMIILLPVIFGNF